MAMTANELAMKAAGTVNLGAEMLQREVDKTPKGKCVQLPRESAQRIVNSMRESAEIIDKLGLLLGDK